ncbi:aldehyde dehydrogenase family protein [Amycolatopsis sp.]|uniref:aldehyde dehydrogenase family protein n=1 Tax=Amycolatopsis sp. TaxID=37632 RepID=UPI002D7F9559|nr:aldehyde dehydrogenase family protein [Amycolatopsis sp.]HET6703859.1 aldehyde dehydrogenase family protein [Amycolatopsis sp.]
MTAAAAGTTPRTTSFGLPGGALIAGEWQTGGLTFAVTDPHDGTPVGWVARNDAADVDAAVRAAARAAAEPWPLWQRREALDEAARLVRDELPWLAGIISAEGSKTIGEAEQEVRRCAETLRLSAAAGPVLRGEVLEFDDSDRGAGKRGWFVRAPLGVVAAITPFNDPLNLVAHKVGPALVAGNGVVVKPADTTPHSALALAELLLRAGVPPARIGVVCGAAATGHALVTHAGVDVVSFTGGPATAARIAAVAGPKKLLMELGGNNPVIVCGDADVEAAADAIVRGAFGCAGQNCLSVQRVYADASIHDALLTRVTAGTRALKVGPKTDRTTDVGPMISEAEAARVEAWVDAALAGGARAHTGARRSGAYYHPTVLTGVPADADVLVREVFGPVVTVVRVESAAAAVAAANSAQALHAGVFTGGLDEALSIADRLQAGAVVVNGTSDLRIDSMPFGGFKSSGIGREGVRFAVAAMSEPRCTIIAGGPQHQSTVNRTQ